jgi:hypothetical protein
MGSAALFARLYACTAGTPEVSSSQVTLWPFSARPTEWPLCAQ